tara:strand:+ start:580 stop:756 length:177 start_codon:yes stop_codon:yes gene_type:complete
MDIKDAKYVKDLVDENILYIDATVDGKLVTIPTDLANRHYAEIMRQVDAGTLTIADAD